MAYDRTIGTRFTAAVLGDAPARLRRLGRFFQALGAELRRMPGYHDEAARLMQGLRRRHANSRGREGADLSDR